MVSVDIIIGQNWGRGENKGRYVSNPQIEALTCQDSKEWKSLQKSPIQMDYFIDEETESKRYENLTVVEPHTAERGESCVARFIPWN